MPIADRLPLKEGARAVESDQIHRAPARVSHTRLQIELGSERQRRVNRDDTDIDVALIVKCSSRRRTEQHRNLDRRAVAQDARDEFDLPCGLRIHARECTRIARIQQPVVVYLAPKQTFQNLRSPGDVTALMLLQRWMPLTGKAKPPPTSVRLDSLTPATLTCQRPAISPRRCARTMKSRFTRRFDCQTAPESCTHTRG